MENLLYRCVRCGCSLGEHNPNLVNESVEDFPWIEEVAAGFTMDILECMETGYPDDYKALLDEHEGSVGCWPGVSEFGIGYVSPDPLEEARQYFETLSAISSDVFLLDLRSGRSYDIGS